MKKSATSKQAKVVIVLATYIFKHLQRVCFTVRSSNGRDTYNTCFTNGHGACNCPAKPGTCYHIKQLAPVAAAKLAARDAKQEAVQAASFDVVTEAEKVAEHAAQITNPAQYQIIHRNGRYVPQRQYASDPLWRDLPAVFHGASLYEARQAIKTHFGGEDAPVVEERLSREQYEALFDPCGLNL